jgi:hypothetical protein
MIKTINTGLIPALFFFGLLFSCMPSANKQVDEEVNDRELKGSFSAKGSVSLDGVTSIQRFKATNEMSVLCTNAASGDFVQVTFKDERSSRSTAVFKVVKAFKSISDEKKENEVDFTYYNNGTFYYSESDSKGKIKTIKEGEDYTIEFEDISVINTADKQMKYISGKISY